MVRYRRLKFMRFPHNRVGTDGSVWRWLRHKSNKRWKRLRPKAGRYLQVTLRYKRRRKLVSIHRLVLEAFVGPCPPGHEARHYPDKDPHNNDLSNLSWATPKVNQRDRVKHGTDCRGEKQGQSILTANDVREMRRLHRERLMKLKDMPVEFNCSYACVLAVVYRRNWRHIKD